MDFFQQIERTDLPRVTHAGLTRDTSPIARGLTPFMRLFRRRLAPLKPLALVNGMVVYDLTQPPLESLPFMRIMRTAARYRVLRREARPISLVLMATAACNMRCRHCSAERNMRRGTPCLSYEELCDVIDQFVELGGASVVFSGGEPTLNPRLLDLVARVPPSKAIAVMFTNGSRIDRTYADELYSAGMFSVLVSIDSPERSEHDARRSTEGAFDQAVQAARYVREAGMLAGISSYMSRPDLLDGGFQRLTRLAEDVGVHQLFLFDAVPTGALLHDTRMVLSPGDRARLRDMVSSYNGLPYGPGIMGQSWVNSSEGCGCFAGFYQAYLTADGELTPCDFTPISFGSVRERPMLELWRAMRASPEWGVRFPECRMQDPAFRRENIDVIPQGEPLPVRYDRLQELRRAHGRKG
ncbi:MAG: radical SAM protein [Pseudomonadota bacterium]